MDQPTTASLFIESSVHLVESSRQKIAHCLDQLEEEDLWWVPREGSNSIGIILQHLAGNLRQWVVAGVGGAVDVRDRPSEFRADDRVSIREARARFDDVLDEVVAVLAGVTATRLAESRRIQGHEVGVLAAIYETTSHLRLHVGQILYLTRLRVGPAYVESWKPTTKEQGA